MIENILNMIVTLTLVFITFFGAILYFMGSFLNKEWCFHFAFVTSYCSIILGAGWIIGNILKPGSISQIEIMTNILSVGLGVSQIYVMRSIGKMPN
jgi:hypothetical protein